MIGMRGNEEEREGEALLTLSGIEVILVMSEDGGTKGGKWLS